MLQEALRALIVDDNEGHRHVLSVILLSQGLRINFAMNGEQAVAAARAVAFDLILMDFNMPVMDGLTATRLIRREEDAAGRPRAKLFVVTSRETIPDQRRARLAGADGHITKPVEVARVVALTEGLGRVAAVTLMASVRVKAR